MTDQEYAFKLIGEHIYEWGIRLQDAAMASPWLRWRTTIEEVVRLREAR